MPVDSRRTLQLNEDASAPLEAAPPHELRRLGRYELLSLLAKGGMGEVYLARARGLGGFEKLVVIKRNLPSVEIGRELLFAEARLVATLQHTNIVQVYDVDIEGPTVFIAMEFLHGQDVRNVLKRAWGRDRRLPLDRAVAIAQAVCAGLHYAHDKCDAGGAPLGIVHRDVSPSNVFVTYDGGVKLIDFGIAKATSLPSETQIGTIKGKPGYMSPEQCRGEPLDRRSDLFCVGILLYEMTAGRRPFQGDSEYLLYREICEGDPPHPTSIDATYPPALEAIVLRALAKDRRDRHATALALQEELARFASEHRLDVSQWALQRSMAELFRDELDAWREAQRTGQSLVEHVIRKVTGAVAAVEPLATTVEDRPPARSGGSSSTSVTAIKPVAERPRSRRRLAVVAGAALVAGGVAVLAIAAREPAGASAGSPASEVRPEPAAGPPAAPAVAPVPPGNGSAAAEEPAARGNGSAAPAPRPARREPPRSKPRVVRPAPRVAPPEGGSAVVPGPDDPL